MKENKALPGRSAPNDIRANGSSITETESRSVSVPQAGTPCSRCTRAPLFADGSCLGGCPATGCMVEGAQGRAQYVPFEPVTPAVNGHKLAARQDCTILANGEDQTCGKNAGQNDFNPDTLPKVTAKVTRLREVSPSSPSAPSKECSQADGGVNSQARQLLTALGEDGYIPLACQGQSGNFRALGSFPLEEALAKIDDLTARDPALHIWHGVNRVSARLPRHRKGYQSDVSRVTALHADIDYTGPAKTDGGIPGRAALDVLLDGLPAPAFIVHTGHGAHPYWLVTDTDEAPYDDTRRAEWEHRLDRFGVTIARRAQAHRWSTDTGVYNTDRMLRTPGTVNPKIPAEPVKAELELRGGSPLEPGEIDDILDREEAASGVAPRSGLTATPAGPRVTCVTVKAAAAWLDEGFPLQPWTTTTPFGRKALEERITAAENAPGRHPWLIRTCIRVFELIFSGDLEADDTIRQIYDTFSGLVAGERNRNASRETADCIAYGFNQGVGKVTTGWQPWELRVGHKLRPAPIPSPEVTHVYDGGGSDGQPWPFPVDEAGDTGLIGALCKLMDQAQPAAGPAGQAVPQPVPGRQPRVTRCSHMTMDKTDWAWEDDDGAGRIPKGALVIAAGREGTGKSSFSLWLAARITRGTLKGCLEGQPRTVLIAAVEDSFSRTIVPRLKAAGADLSKVGRLDVVEAGKEDVLGLPVDNELLEQAITEHGAALVIFDPLMSMIDGRIDTHKERSLRQALDPLAKVADRTGAVLLGIAHFNKSKDSDASNRITGGGAFKNVARAIISFAGDDEGSHVMTQTKNSFGRADLDSLAYKIEEAVVERPGDGLKIATSKFVFDGVSERSVADILSSDGNGKEEKSEADSAVDWLKHILNAREVKEELASVIFREGVKNGYEKHTLQRARKKIGAKTRKAAMGDGWVWSLRPDVEQPLEDDEDDEGDSEKETSPSPSPSARPCHLRAVQTDLQDIAGQTGQDDTTPDDKDNKVAFSIGELGRCIQCTKAFRDPAGEGLCEKCSEEIVEF